MLMSTTESKTSRSTSRAGSTDSTICGSSFTNSSIGDQVVVVTDLLGRGRATGADVAGAYVFPWTIRDGRVVEVREYETKEEALEAAGSAEQQDAHPDF
jgi:hypothetical protein